MGTGAFLPDESGFIDAALHAGRVFCPGGHWLMHSLAEAGVKVHGDLAGELLRGDLLLLWGGPELDDPWLSQALAQGAQVRWAAPLSVALGLGSGCIGRAASSRAPWPTAQAVAVYGQGDCALPSELIETADGSLHGPERTRTGPVLELGWERGEGEVLYVPALGDRSALSFAAAKSVMARLRAPDGCPWDRDQTPSSLLPYLLEEAAEAYDAILGGNVHEMREELGDLLLQVLFHAQIAEEEGRFSAGDVALSLRDKLRRRHPHVFGEEHYRTAEEFVPRWEELKRQEQHGRESELSGIPAALGSMAAADKAMRRLYRAGVEEVSTDGWLRQFEPAILAGRDIEAELRTELLELRARCTRAEEILGGRMSQFPPAEVKSRMESLK